MSFIEIKQYALKTYQNLHRILTECKGYLTSFAYDKKNQESIMVVFSDNRPLEFIKSQTIRYVDADGRIKYPDSGFSSGLMLVVKD